MPQLDILYQQVKPPKPGMDYILLSHWPEESHRISPTSSAIAKAMVALQT